MVVIRKKVKNLGVIMDCDPFFTSQLRYVCQISCFALKGLYLNANALLLNIKIKLCESLVFPTIDYCLCVYFPCLTKNIFIGCKKSKHLHKVLLQFKEI